MGPADVLVDFLVANGYYLKDHDVRLYLVERGCENHAQYWKRVEYKGKEVMVPDSAIDKFARQVDDLWKYLAR